MEALFTTVAAECDSVDIVVANAGIIQGGLEEGSKVIPPAGGLTERLRKRGSAWNDRASARFNQ